jgi:hypothetical protein
MTKRKKLLLILLILAALGVSVAGSIWFRNPFPATQEIAKIEVTSYYPSPHRHVAFDLTPEEWQNLRNTIIMPTVDFSPSKWVLLAALKITTHDGREFILCLADGDKTRGSFSVDHTYYRGGNAAASQQALTAAYQAATTRGAVRTLGN